MISLYPYLSLRKTKNHRGRESMLKIIQINEKIKKSYLS